MNWRSLGTSTRLSCPASFIAALIDLWLPSILSGNTSAMATSLMGPLVRSAFSAAPVPRPPQPTRATRISFSSAACTNGTDRPAKAVAATEPPAACITERLELFMVAISG